MKNILETDDDIKNLFECLSKEARRVPMKGCMGRSRRLAYIFRARGHNACFLEITHKIALDWETTFGSSIKSRFASEPWAFHYAVEVNRVVYDPNLGYPIDRKGYVNAAYTNRSSSVKIVRGKY